MSFLDAFQINSPLYWLVSLGEKVLKVSKDLHFHSILLLTSLLCSLVSMMQFVH